MMFSLLTMLMGIVAAEPEVDTHYPEAVEVFACGFDESVDINHDRWPDHWKRQRGPRHPTYMDIEIVRDKQDRNKRYLQVEMNGGAALIHSGPIPISPLFSYVLETSLRTQGLEHSTAYISASYYDLQHRLVDLAGTSRRIGGTHEWSRLRVGPFSTSRKRAAYVVISLHVEPHEGEFDLNGVAQFDDIWLARLPRMMLYSNSPHNVFTDSEDVEITCTVTGIQQRDPMITFELVDLSSRTLAEMNGRLDGQVVALSSNKISELVRQGDEKVEHTENGYQGTMTWRPPLTGNGFYRVRVRMLGDSGVMHEREISVVIVRPQPPPSGNEFGWSMPQGDNMMPLEAIAGLLEQVGIGWVKFPVWFEETDQQRANQLARFIEKLNTKRIDLVGIVDQPPPSARQMFSESLDRLPAASIFAQSDVWYEALSPVLTRLSLKVQSWQLGADDDTSFMGHPMLIDKITEVDQQIARLGQKVRLGISWRWLNEVPDAEAPPWRFLSLVADPQMTADEIAAYLQSTAGHGARRWVMLEPLPKDQYSVETRARDLVLRMIASKMNGADVTYATDPFDDQTGLMHADGTPGELLLPWRTTAYMVSGTQYIGSIELPGGSHNHILVRGSQAMMVVWNETPTEEVINLGDTQQIEHVDVWGRVTKPEKRGHRQAYQIGPMPTFITGVSREMALWRMDFELVDPKLESLYGRAQYPRFRLRNPFRQGAAGTMQIHIPANWGNPPRPARINMSGSEQRIDRMEIVLRSNASSGEETVRIDFNITADRDYQFSLWRTMEVGLGDVIMEFETRLDDAGNLVVEQKMTNTTDMPVNFKCFLFPPGRRRVRSNVLDLGRGTNQKFYTLPDGEQLIGQTLWVRAEEIYGNRVLNYRFGAEAN